MKGFTTALLIAFSAAAFAQDEANFMQPLPPELKQVEWMLGDWEAKELDFNFGAPVKGSGSASGKMALNGRYVISQNTYSMPGLPAAMEGLHVMTYDPNLKKFVAHWFDGSAPEAMRMTGTVEGDKLTMVSDETEMAGMGKVVMRAAWTKKSDKQMEFKLEMKQGEDWASILAGTYSKK